MKSKIIWYLRQLLPLAYKSTYGEGDQRYHARWRMWFGRVFAHEVYRLAE